MIGLNASAGDDQVCSLAERFGQSILQLADFVARSFDAGQVIALDVNFPAVLGRKFFQGIDGRGQKSQFQFLGILHRLKIPFIYRICYFSGG